MSKEELEREAGGKIFTSENEETRNQVENTRYQGGSSSYDQSSGATETRLTENKQYESSSASGSESGGSSMGGGAQVYQGGNSGYRSSYEYENSISSGSNFGNSDIGRHLKRHRECYSIVLFIVRTVFRIRTVCTHCELESISENVLIFLVRLKIYHDHNFAVCCKWISNFTSEREVIHGCWLVT